MGCGLKLVNVYIYVILYEIMLKLIIDSVIDDFKVLFKFKI